MFEDAGAGRLLAERAVAGDRAVGGHFDQLAGFDFADKIGTDDIERDSLAGKYDGIPDPAHDQRPDPQGIAAGDHAFGGHADQRIGAFHQL